MHKIIPLSDYGLLKISGEDACNYLQGQITVDVESLAEGRITLASQCDSKGKAWSTFYLYVRDSDFYLLGDKTALANSEKELKKYAVFSKVNISNITDSSHIYGVLDAQDITGSAFPKKPGQTMQYTKNDTGVLFALRGETERYVLISTRELSNDMLAEAPEAWASAEIRAGIPHLSAATSSSFVPQMFNLQALDGISFSKGCYMGQETIARTKYLGKNKRAGFIIHSKQNCSTSAGDTLEQNLGDNWRRAGTVLSKGHDEGGTWIFAVLPNDLTATSELRLKADPDIRFSIVELPYTIDE